MLGIDIFSSMTVQLTCFNVIAFAYEHINKSQFRYTMLQIIPLSVVLNNFENAGSKKVLFKSLTKMLGEMVSSLTSKTESLLPALETFNQIYCK